MSWRRVLTIFFAVFILGVGLSSCEMLTGPDSNTADVTQPTSPGGDGSAVGGDEDGEDASEDGEDGSEEGSDDGDDGSNDDEGSDDGTSDGGEGDDGSGEEGDDENGNSSDDGDDDGGDPSDEDGGDEGSQDPDDSGDDSATTEDGEEITLVRDELPEQPEVLSVSKLIDIDGGELSLAGHRLTVPAGAVLEPTLFTMELVQNDYVEVELTATVTDLLGNVIEVGTELLPFLKPVRLTLTYERSPNVPEAREADLRIMRMLGETHDDPHEPLASDVDTVEKTVTSPLEHFTGYCMAY